MSTDQIARITKAGLDRMERELEQGSPPPPPPQAETVYAHVERTVHRLLDEIHREATARVNSPDWAAPIKHLADAVQALSSWPQFNPMNAVDDYKKLAENEVERAVKAKLDHLQRGLSVKVNEIDANLQVTR